MSTQTRLSTLVINMVAVLVVATPSAVYPSLAANQDRETEVVQVEKQDQFLIAQENSLATPTPIAQSENSAGNSVSKIEKIAYAELLKKGYTPLHSEAPNGIFTGVYVKSADSGDEISSATSGDDFEFLICVNNITYDKQSATMSFIVRNPSGIYQPFTHEYEGRTLSVGHWCYHHGREEIPWNVPSGNWSFQGILHASSTTNGGSSVKTVNITSVSTSPPTPTPTEVPSVLMRRVYLATNRAGDYETTSVQAGSAFYPVIYWTNRANRGIYTDWTINITYNGQTIVSEQGSRYADPGDRSWRMETFGRPDIVMPQNARIGTYKVLGRICASTNCESAESTFSVVAAVPIAPTYTSTPRPPTFTPIPPTYTSTPRPPTATPTQVLPKKVTGKVLSKNGKPLPGISVTALTEYDNNLGPMGRSPAVIGTTYTNKDGEFVMNSNLIDGQHYTYIKVLLQQEPKDCGLSFNTREQTLNLMSNTPNSYSFEFKANEIVGDLRNRTIVFVHGWNSNAKTSFASLDRIMREDGYFVFCAPLVTSFLNLSEGTSYTPHIETNARKLDQLLVEYLKYTENEKAILIAHSMGGLVSRFYIETPELFKKNVDSLFTFGSPHEGIRQTFQALQLDLKLLGQDVIVNFLSSESKNFNDTHKKPSGVTYYYVGGNQMLEGIFPLALEAISSIARVAATHNPATIYSRYNDGVVPLHSSLGDHLSEGYRLNPKDGIENNHLNYFIDGRLSNAYSKCLEPVLSRSDPNPSGCGEHISWPLYLKENVTNIYQFSQSKFSQIGSRTLLSGDNVTRKILVDGGNPVFAAQWDEGLMSLALMDPSGKVIDYSGGSNGKFGNVTFEKTTGWMAYKIDNATSGEWQMIVKSQQSPSSGTRISIFALFDSSLSLSAGLDRAWYKLGETATLTAKLDGLVIKNATATARIWSGGNVVDVVPMTFDGKQFAATYAIPLHIHLGFVDFQITGVTQDNKPFERGGMLDFYVPGSTNYLPALTNMLDNGPPVEIPQPTDPNLPDCIIQKEKC